MALPTRLPETRCCVPVSASVEPEATVYHTLSAGQQQPDGLPRDGTAYASAKDSALGPVFAAFGRIRGGACRAAGDNAGEGAAMAFDGAQGRGRDEGCERTRGSGQLEGSC